jgi:hypothetical protein
MAFIWKPTVLLQNIWCDLFQFAVLYLVVCPKIIYFFTFCCLIVVGETFSRSNSRNIFLVATIFSCSRIYIFFT